MLAVLTCELGELRSAEWVFRVRSGDLSPGRVVAVGTQWLGLQGRIKHLPKRCGRNQEAIGEKVGGRRVVSLGSEGAPKKVPLECAKGDIQVCLPTLVVLNMSSVS